MKKDAIVELITDNTGVSTEQAKIIANAILKLQKNVYVVLSRDSSDFIYTTTDKAKAEKVRSQRELDEERAGGRPSVYIKTTILN
jgi:hypothetical protein